MSEWVLTKPKIKYNKSDDIKTKLAKIRGVKDLHRFLTPSVEDLHDPYLLGNITTVAFKIMDAIKNEKSISVYFDADNDGCCAGAIIFNFILNFTDKVQWFMTDQIKAHGIAQGMHCVPKETELLIIVDSSSNDADACKELSERGIDIVIIDHHEVSTKNEHATIVNPQLDDYPNKSISGSALTWKLVQVIEDTLGTDYHETLIDLAGSGLISDVMRMDVPENRYIASEALQRVHNIGLLAILKRNKKDPKWDTLNTNDIGYSIAPVINGCIRLGKAQKAAQILTTKDENEAKQLAKEMFKLNDERKELQKQMTESVIHKVNENDKIIIVVDDEFSIDGGFRGLIAGELASRYKRPVMLVSPSKGLLQGSCRSYGGFDLKGFLETLPKGFIAYTAGHSGAFGIGIYTNKVDKLREQINKALGDAVFEQTVEYDIELDASEVTEEVIKDIQQFNRLSGEGFPEVKVRVNNLFVSDVDILGKSRNTVKIDCGELKLLKFRTDEKYAEEFPVFETIDVVGLPLLNVYYNFGIKRKVITPQVFIDDYRKIGW